MLLNHCSIHYVFNSHCQKGIMALILWQCLFMVSFSESIKALLTVNKNCLHHSLELGNCQSAIMQMLIAVLSNCCSVFLSVFQRFIGKDQSSQMFVLTD